MYDLYGVVMCDRDSDPAPQGESVADLQEEVTGAERDSLVRWVRETTDLPQLDEAVRSRGYERTGDTQVVRGCRPDDPFDIYQVGYQYCGDDGEHGVALWRGLHPERLDSGAVSYEMVHDLVPDDASFDSPLPLVAAYLGDVALSPTDDGFEENRIDRQGLRDAAEAADTEPS